MTAADPLKVEPGAAPPLAAAVRAFVVVPLPEGVPYPVPSAFTYVPDVAPINAGLPVASMVRPQVVPTQPNAPIPPTEKG